MAKAPAAAAAATPSPADSAAAPASAAPAPAPASADKPAEGQPAPAESATILGAVGTPAPAPAAGAEPPKPAEGIQPVDWRAEIAKDNKDMSAFLKRYSTPEALATAAFNSDKKLSSKIKPGLPDDATSEQRAAYLKDAGIPEALEDYVKTALSNGDGGLILGEQERAPLDGFLKMAHDKAYPPEFARMATEAYIETIGAQAAEMAEKDANTKQETLQTLQMEWKGDYKANLNAANAWLARFPAEVQQVLNTARDADGVFLLHRADVLKSISQMARELDPSSTVVVGGAGPANSQSIEARIKEIEDGQKTQEGLRAYYKDQKLQDEYKGLLAWREAHKAA